MPKKIDYIISPCPFCGSVKAPTVTTAQESEQCVHFESASCKCFELDAECEIAHVVCDMTKGGCGASSGYCLSKGEAVSKWNARPEPSEQKKRSRQKKAESGACE